jgi:hypothetical protein
MDEPKKPYISPSRLGMYEKCGEQYRRRYIEGEKIPPGIALVKGTGVHGGAKGNFRQKIVSREDLPRKDIVEISVTSYEEALSKGGLSLTKEEESIGYHKVVAQGKDGVVTLSGLYADEMAPAYQPLLVEEDQLVTVPSSEYDLKGIIDLVDAQESVIDLKTGSKKKNEDEVHTSEQLTFYALLYKAKTGRLPTSVRLEVLIDTKKPQRQPLVGYRTMEDLGLLISRINAMTNGIKKGVFIPTQPTSWWCSERWCGYYRSCPYIKKGV